MRKLAIAAFSFAAASLAVLYITGVDFALKAALILAVLGAAVQIVRGRPRVALSIALMAASLGLLWLWGYTELVSAAADGVAGKTTLVTAEATDFSERTDYGARLTLNVYAGGKRLKTVAYVYNDTAPEISPGDRLEFYSKLKRTDSGDSYYISRGYKLKGSVNGDVNTVGRADLAKLKYAHKYLARAVKETVFKVFPDDAAPFAEALITGDKDRLNEDAELASALKIAGISHVVAVSGMHIAFLMGFIILMLGKRRWAPLAAVPIMLVFMAMVGFTASVVRAGVMQIILIAAPIVRREYDPVTAIAFALGLITLQNPYSLQDVGLQLSFAATLGIVTITVPVSNFVTKRLSQTRLSDRKFIYKATLSVCASAFSSLGAIAFTLPLSALHFGYISIIAPVTNLLVFWAVSLAFTGTVIACLAGMILPFAGKLTGFLTAYPIRYIIAATKLMARSSVAAASVHSVTVMVWIVMAYMMGSAFVLLRAKPRQLIFTGCVAVVTLCAALIFANTPSSDETLTVTALDVGQGQCTVLESGKYAFIVDCGGQRGDDAGDAAVSHLASKRRGAIDALVITSYKSDRVNGVSQMADFVDIGAFLLPAPCDGDEAAQVTLPAATLASGTSSIKVGANVELTLASVSQSASSAKLNIIPARPSKVFVEGLEDGAAPSYLLVNGQPGIYSTTDGLLPNDGVFRWKDATSGEWS
ncbi:MAG: ComEC/Rec2 family competence protein, partial [Oscillospiraceae bacterium]|nr:ComEC/Rec2 family competence protein [Oscillospiraceae bacterium]